MLKYLYTLFVMLFIVFVHAEIQLPRITPSEYIISFDRNQLNTDTGLELALYLGTNSVDTVARENIALLLSDIQMSFSDLEDQEILAEKVLHYLHDTVLKRYSVYQSRLDILVEKGTYNCVSSAILYTLALMKLNIPVEAVLTDDHAFCRVRLDDDFVDVETTTRYGFRPGIQKDFQDEFGRTGFTYVPPNDTANRQNISILDLFSLILQNRISEKQKQNRYDLSVSIAVDRMQLLESETAYAAMVQEFSNYLSMLNNQKKFSKAFAFFDSVQHYYGYEVALAPVIQALAYNALIQKLQEHHFEDARYILDYTEALQDYAVDQDELDSLYNESRLQYYAKNYNFESAYASMMDITDDMLLLEKYLVYIYIQEANKQIQEGDFRKAMTRMDEALTSFSGNQILLDARNSYLRQFEIQIHNEFVTLFNAGKNDAAAVVLQKGLDFYPDSRILQNNLQYLD